MHGCGSTGPTSVFRRSTTRQAGRTCVFGGGLAFDNPSHETNLRNLSQYREQMGPAEQELGLVLRDGKGGSNCYLVRRVPLEGDVDAALIAAADTGKKILDLVLGHEVIQAGYRRRRDQKQQNDCPAGKGTPYSWHRPVPHLREQLNGAYDPPPRALRHL